MTDSELQTKRLTAAAIDIAISIAISVGFAVTSWVATIVLVRMSDSNGAITTFVPRLVGFVGAAIGLGYVLGRDILGGGRSLGKKFQNIRVVTLAGAPVGLMDSAKRNAIFAIGSLLGFLSATLRLIPCLGDVVACLITPLIFLGILVSLVAAILEVVKITGDPEGIRMGDAFAGTRVIR